MPDGADMGSNLGIAVTVAACQGYPGYELGIA